MADTQKSNAMIFVSDYLATTYAAPEVSIHAKSIGSWWKCSPGDAIRVARTISWDTWHSERMPRMYVPVLGNDGQESSATSVKNDG